MFILLLSFIYFYFVFYSRRVLADISSAELMSNNKDEHIFTLSVVAREWNPHVLPEWEFRGKRI